MTRARARLVEAWNHTALLAAIVANTARDPKRRRKPFTAADFHPFADRKATRGRPLTRETMRDLKLMLGFGKR